MKTLEELKAIEAAYFEAVNERKAPTRETTPTTVARGEDSFFQFLPDMEPDKEFWSIATIVAACIGVFVSLFWMWVFGMTVTMREVLVAIFVAAIVCIIGMYIHQRRFED